MLTFGTRSFTWEHGRQLASQTVNGSTWTYSYNADGMRTGRTNGTNTYEYVYNGSQLMQMTRNGVVMNFTYINGIPATISYGGNTFYYVVNGQGDITGITDAQGNIQVTYYYDAWGASSSIYNSSSDYGLTLATINPLRYRGYVFDWEVGLYYLQSRYYIPEIGRFLNADGLVSTGQGILGNNMFAYCGNNSVCRSDPSGCGFLDVLDAVVNVAKEIGRTVVAAVRYVLPLTENDKVLIATIAAEATVTAEGEPVSSEARQAMANVAINRVGSREWKDYENVAQVCEKSGFDGYGDENYIKCMEYLNARDYSDSTYESIVWSVMKAYSWDITNGCQLYYTPAAMRPEGATPRWNFDLLEEVVIPGIDTWYEGKFYRYK